MRSPRALWARFRSLDQDTDRDLDHVRHLDVARVRDRDLARVRERDLARERDRDLERVRMRAHGPGSARSNISKGIHGLIYQGSLGRSYLHLLRLDYWA